MAISATNVNLFLDHVSRIYARLLSTDNASAYGMGAVSSTNLAAGSAEDLEDAVLATADASVVNALLLASTSYKTSLSAVKIGCPKSILAKLDKALRDLALTGVSSLNTYLTYYNRGAGGTNTALQSQYFRALYYNWRGSYPTATNLYFELLQGEIFGGVTFTNALRKLVVGTGQTAGTDISTDYAGGVPYLKVSAFAGASDTVTVTGTQYDPVAGTRTTGKTWTATVAANGDIALASGGATPASANALICAVSGIVAGASITAATTIYVEAKRPTGRLKVPF